MTEFSNCCLEPVIVGGEGETHYYVCSSCQLPADPMVPKRGYDFCGCGNQKKRASKTCIKCKNYSKPKKHRENISKALVGNKNALGFKHNEAAKERIRISKLGENNPMWKNKEVGYGALHDWIKRRTHRPSNCQMCFKNCRPDLANKSGEYKRDLSDWVWLCRSCHMKSDGRLARLMELNRQNRIMNFFCCICGNEYKPKRLTSRFCSKSCHATYHNLYVKKY
jgi:hypothetical protein